MREEEGERSLGQSGSGDRGEVSENTIMERLETHPRALSSSWGLEYNRSTNWRLNFPRMKVPSPPALHDFQDVRRCTNCTQNPSPENRSLIL